MVEFDDRNAGLPTAAAFTYPNQPILNIHARQYGFIRGKPGATFNRLFHTGFYVPGKGVVKDVFNRPLSVAEKVTLRAAPYQSKVARDAVDALHAVEKERAKQAYFDELDANNLFPRRGRTIALPRSVASQTNSDGSATIFHQPAWVRTQQNQFVGDVTSNVQRGGDSHLPEKGNSNAGKPILGINPVVTKRDDGESLTDEIGRLGKVSGITFGTQTSPVLSPPKHAVRDMRSVASETNMPDIGRTTLDLIFANGGRFQTFMDQLRFGNETLQQQLRGQEAQLGNISAATMSTFKNILVSMGFQESSLPATISPDEMLRLVKQVETISPVAITEIAAMRTLIETLKKQRTQEVADMGTQYSPPSTPAAASSRPVPPPIQTQWQPRGSPTPSLPSVDSIFGQSSLNSSPERYGHSSGRSTRPMSISPDVAPQFSPEPQPSAPGPSSLKRTADPTQTEIFGPEYTVEADQDTPVVPLQKAAKGKGKAPAVRSSKREAAAPEKLSDDAGFKQTSTRKGKGKAK
ncbi:uncharacterized protein EV422DRAFT_571730 [Fimicolochytrium jonesii]|uniref:uncharacterized protein n=1 Tax=Fimicolochytrium jonesii TaxID=1396493 RepID=UPI0022FE1383|nr:uncharacterized protein EV422DRAFT_571730 [Fimicolochytrium jonesii]KAI8816358.1 hypothetical protein EV422DRAFT_571730 [Fimicolochytrium jonesii]